MLHRRLWILCRHLGGINLKLGRLALLSLANNLAQQGRYQEGEKLLQQLLKKNEFLYGKRHQQTLKTVAFLANLMLNQGRLQEAELLSNRALGGLERALGLAHPAIHFCFSNDVCKKDLPGRDHSWKLSKLPKTKPHKDR